MSKIKSIVCITLTAALVQITASAPLHPQDGGGQRYNDIQMVEDVRDFVPSASGSPTERAGSTEPVTLVTSDPDPPRRGQLMTLEIEIINPSDVARAFRVEGELTAALFLGGSDGVQLALDDPNPPRSSFAWPELQLAPHSVGRLRLETIPMKEDEGAVGAQFEITDLNTAEAELVSFEREASWPESSSRVSWTAFLGGLGLGLLIGILAAYLTARLIWRRVAGTKGRIAAVLVVVLAIGLGAALVLTAAGDVRMLTSYREATCAVTDRLVVPRTLVQHSGSDSRSRIPTFQPLLALEVRNSDGGSVPAIWGGGRGDDVAVGRLEWATAEVAAFEPGTQHACWVDPSDSTSLAMSRDVTLWPYLLMLFFLACIAAPGLLARRGGRSRPS